MTKPGTVLDGKYEILKEIGRGGMSYVYLAMDTRLNKQWAVKEVKKNANNQQNQLVVQSLITEAHLMKKLNHPSFPRIVDIIENANTIYVVMDYVEGESLESVLKISGKQSEDDVIDWAIQLCDALEYLHTRIPPIVHRDIKPANIICQPEPKNSIKVLDLGIAKELVEKDSSGTKCIGTPGYASPEQSIPGMKLDGRSDIYSLGATMHHLLTGLDPRRNVGFKRLRLVTGRVSDKTEGLEYIIQKCLNQDANLRYQTCSELRYDLEHVEQLTEDYRRKQKNKVNIFVSFVSLTVVFAMLSCLFAFLFINKKADTIDSYLQEMNNSYALISDLNFDRPDYEQISDNLVQIKDDMDGIKMIANGSYTNSESFAAYSVYMYSLNNKYKLSTLNADSDSQAECYSVYADFKEDAVEFATGISQSDNPNLAVYASTLNALSFVFDDSQDTIKAKQILQRLNTYIDAHPNINSELKQSNIKDIMDSFEQGITTGFLGDGEKISEIVNILTSITDCIEKTNNLSQNGTDNMGIAGESSYIDGVNECVEIYSGIIDDSESADLSSTFKLYVYRKINSFILSNASNKDVKDNLVRLCNQLDNVVDNSIKNESNSETREQFNQLKEDINKSLNLINNYNKNRISKNQ